MNLKGNAPQVAPSKDKPKARTGAFSVATSSKPRNGMDCAHCQRIMNNFEGGYSRGYNNEPLCHPNAKNRPDCYRLVTTYNHPTPCPSSTCYEDHEFLETYIIGFELTNTSKESS